MRKSKGITLRLTLSVLVIVSVFLTALVTGYSAIKANMQSLSSSYLESNYQYAKKVALNTSDLLTVMQKNIDSLAYIAGAQGAQFNAEDVDTFFQANRQYFNSVLFVDADRNVRAVIPTGTGVSIGTRLTSDSSIEAVQSKIPMISNPYMAASKRLILLISSPVFHPDGSYAGFIGGTIYLQEDNVLSRLLTEHLHGNGSYLYVVDKSRRLIFHPDKARINEYVSQNTVIDKVLMKQNAARQVVNSEGQKFFAGYAYEPEGGWGIVSQTPTSVLNEPRKRLVMNVILQVFPFFLLILLVAWWVAHSISKPLHQLAKFSEEASSDTAAVSRPIEPINSRIYEVNQLYQSVNHHLSLLNTEIQTDGLTGLANRRSFDFTLQQWVDSKIPFSLILLDIDHFKSINDRYGHLMGDEVLKYLARIMRTLSREIDLCFRYGGEEFGILVKYGKPESAVNLAERLRQSIANTPSPTGDPITVSIGISSSQSQDELPHDLIEMADHALYQSKEEGRNKITFSAS